jgi:type III restriction enzyme
LFLWRGLADEAALRIYNACVRGGLERSVDDQPGGATSGATLLPVMDPYNPAGSSRFVDLHTSKDLLWITRADCCHVNLVVCDSEWEHRFCETIENALGDVVLAYVKNHGLGFEVPYAAADGERRYRPDFILRVDDGNGPGEPLNLVVEIKGSQADRCAKQEAGHGDALGPSGQQPWRLRPLGLSRNRRYIPSRGNDPHFARPPRRKKGGGIGNGDVGL